MIEKSFRRAPGLLTAALFFVVLPAFGAERPSASDGSLWTNPTDIATRDMRYGNGGKAHAPKAPFTFVKEDLDGTNPKLQVTDKDGIKWKVKMGVEAGPETAASRLVWAAGYHTNEDYFLSSIQVANLPAHLKRGQSQVRDGGLIDNVRLKRDDKQDEKRTGSWKWAKNPYTGTRELNGLRVMMALMNNWDLKDDNNAIYEEKNSSGKIYMVSDLGATFGATHEGVSHDGSKGNLDAYQKSKWIGKVKSEYVDFNVPGAPAIIMIFNPKEYFSRIRLRGIGKHVPRDDAKWIGGVLAQLSRTQVREVFRSAGYSESDVEGFATVVERRIADLKKL